MGPCIINIFKHNQQDATLHNGIYYYKCCTCFRRFLRPSSGAQNCIHRIGYLSSFFCFLPLSWVGWNCTNIRRYLVTFPPMAVNLNLVPKDLAERISVCWHSKSYGLDDPGSISGRYKRFYFFPKATRQAFETTQPSIWWVPATFTGTKVVGAWNWPLIAI